MTTVAWDGKTLATDSMISRGDIDYQRGPKLFRLSSGFYMAGAGNHSDLVKFKNHMDSPSEDTPKLESVAVIIVSPDGHAYECYDSFTRTDAPNMAAQGSGWQIALAVMMNGGSAVDAIRIACKLDVHTAGPINWVTFPTNADTEIQEEE